MRRSLRRVRWPSWLLVALLVGAAAAMALRGAPRPAPEAPRPATGAAVAAGERRPAGGAEAASSSRTGFRSERRLREHFEKHGAEFGAADAGEYLAIAQALRDAPAGGPVLEAVRADGVVTRFDRRDGTFLAFERDGTIRTCFRPNDGERYFRRQAARPAAP